MSSNKRIILLLERLYRKTDAHNYETTVSLRKYLEEELGSQVDLKTFATDMNFLLGLDIGIRKIKSSPNKFTWDKRLFELAELQMLTDAVLSSRAISKNKSQELIKKLSSLISENEAGSIKETIGTSGKHKTYNPHVYYAVNTIIGAIKRKKRITFKYTEYNQYKEIVYRNEGKSYNVSPYKLHWNDDNYYLIGWDEKHADITVFRIDRMENVKVKEDKRAKKFVPAPEDFNSDDYADRFFQMYDGEEVQVELEVRNDLMKYIIDKFGIEVESEVPEGDTDYGEQTGYFIAKPTVRLSPTFYAWVFQFAGGIKLRGPEKAVDEYREMLGAVK